MRVPQNTKFQQGLESGYLANTNILYEKFILRHPHPSIDPIFLQLSPEHTRRIEASILWDAVLCTYSGKHLGKFYPDTGSLTRGTAYSDSVLLTVIQLHTNIHIFKAIAFLRIL